MSANPFERDPHLQPALMMAMDFVRIIFGRSNIRLTRVVLAVEFEQDGEKLRTAASWPSDEMDKGADIAREAVTILQMGHAAQQARGEG